jgi:hypothetical protein
MGLHDLVRRLADADAALSDTAAALPGSGPGPAAFGADGPGALGELAADLHRLWATAVDARTREAAAHAARLSDVADAVSRADTGYGDVDDAARERHRG